MPHGPRYHQVPSSDQPTQEVPLVCDEDEHNTTAPEPLPSYGDSAVHKTGSQQPDAYTLPSYEEVQEMKRQHNEERTTSASSTMNVLATERMVGTDAAFVLSFLVAFLLNGIGFLCAFCMSSSLAGRYGATSGFGLALVKISVIFYHVYAAATNTSAAVADDDDNSVFFFGIYRPSPSANPAVANSTATGSDGSARVTAVVYEDSEDTYGDDHPPHVHMWLTCLLFFFGIILFLHGIMGYVRAKATMRRTLLGA